MGAILVQLMQDAAARANADITDQTAELAQRLFRAAPQLLMRARPRDPESADPTGDPPGGAITAMVRQRLQHARAG
eukprot:8310128-Heterocapsa_arctica.AAC.1